MNYIIPISIVLKKAPNALKPSTMAPYTPDLYKWFPPEVQANDGILVSTADRARWPDPPGMVA